MKSTARREESLQRKRREQRRRRDAGRQGVLPFRSWGGPRPGAGRKPSGAQAGVPHRPRAALASRYPVHVTVRLRRGLPNLRRRAEQRVLRAAFARACDRFGLRLVQYSVQRDHLHLLVEARDRCALSRGMQGLSIRIAKRLNRAWSRTGSVFADRYHDRVLRTPREVRNALLYVLQNGRKHGAWRGRAFDPCTSGWWFDGWREPVRVRGIAELARPVAQARTWLMTVGWRRHGLVGLRELCRVTA